MKEILADLNFNSLEDLKQWIDDLKSGKRKDENEFVWSIMKSPYVDYHYSLMKDKTLSEKFRRNLMSRFDEHNEKGQALLLSKLDNNEDIDFHAEIIFMLGKLNNRRNSPDRNKVVDYAEKLALSSDSYTRDRAIIVLGWIGSMKDIPLLADRLLNDPDEKCRTWAATSFMQMWFRDESQELVEQVLPYLQQSIAQEKDYFALGCMISTVQELTKKRFGLAQKDIDNTDKEKIDSAKLKVERFLNKRYNK
ncbi:MAG: HEAT repeat domain-containing protein [Tannerella sp.]|jgi:hypothetical protein|nr:HEAT repeat domain-containing protein [Tannerella sp.]